MQETFVDMAPFQLNRMDAPDPGVPLGLVSTHEIPGLYRATHQRDWDEHGTIRPREFVTSSFAWPSVAMALDDPAALVKLALERNNIPPPVRLEKLIAEAVFEQVRLEVVPDAPSRLNCVFAALDAYGAMDFAAETSGAPIIDQATGDVVNWPVAKLVSTGGRPWIALDMRLFSMHPRTATDEIGMVEQLGRLKDQARDYWKGRTGPTPLIEVLVEAVDLPGALRGSP